MGRKSKSRSELEDLRGIIRHLEAENKQLRKQLARSTKEIQRAVDTVISFVDDEPPVEYTPPSAAKCSKCGHKVKVIELGPKLFYNCSNESCLHRKLFKK
jgi:formylmethanofuran dehydrogenase subunit E